MGTASADTEFSPLGNDNLFHPNGFTNCVTASETPTQVGVGLLATEPDRVVLRGISWIDESRDGVRNAGELPRRGQEIVAYRCEPPWGIVGQTSTDDNGVFEMPNVRPGNYQFGVMAIDETFSPLGADNEVHPNGFTSCVTFIDGTEYVGVGVLP